MWINLKLSDLALQKASQQIIRLVRGQIHHRHETKLVFIGLCD